MKHIGVIGTISIFIIVAAMIFGASEKKQNQGISDSGEYNSAYFAGGCFWCMEGIFEAQEGVQEARVGYIGGNASDANYASVSSGNTRHREAVKISYDPEKISYDKLIDLFWTQIDPTDPDGQFADKGFHYTTAIYHSDTNEKQIALASKQKLQDSDKFEKDIVTKVLPYTEFFEAESYHQDYYKKSSFRYNLYAKGSGRKGFIEQNWAERIAELNEQTYSDASLQDRLTPIQYKVTQQDGTEPPFDNAYWDNKKPGIYVDIIDGNPLYSSLDKYDSGTGWPSFSRAIDENHITTRVDKKLFMQRTEARSASSDAHLGHIFPDGPKDAGGMRHCINSAALKFIPVDELEQEGYDEYLELFE